MVRLTDHVDVAIAVDWGVKLQTKQSNKHLENACQAFVPVCMKKGT